MTEELNKKLFQLRENLLNWEVITLNRPKDDELIEEFAKIVSRMAGYGMCYNGNKVSFKRYS